MLLLFLWLGCRPAPGTDPTDTDAPHTDTSDTDALVCEGDCLVCQEAGYWPLVATTADADLRTALNTATGTVSCTYTRAREILFSRIDHHDSGVTCVYTGAFFEFDRYPPDWNLVNTEHTWPQSQGAELPPQECDLHHLYPVDAVANGKRGDNPFGEVVGSVSWSAGGSQLGKDAGDQTVFEPRDDHKGNVARSMLYFAVRYGKTLPADQLATFRAWNADDPPDAREIERTFEIYDEQDNANPFVVCEGLVERFVDAE